MCILFLVGFSACSNNTITAYPSGRNPDQIVINPSQEASTSVSISWRSNNEINNGIVEYKGPNNKDSKSQKATFQIINSSEISKIKNDPIIHRFTTTLSDLQANTIYTYRVCNQLAQNNSCSSWHKFQTAPDDDNDEFEFIYLGDVQTGIENWVENFMNVISQKSNYRFAIIAGDLVDNGTKRNQFDMFLGGKQNTFADIIFMPVIGNHDFRDDGFKLYKKTYVLPENSKLNPELDYWVKYGSTLFLIMNSNVKKNFKEQALWMEKVIKSNPSRWIILSFHHPIWSSHKIRNNSKLRKRWMPTIEKMGVNLVLNGHDHAYMRTHPTISGKINPNGPTYVVSVSGKKKYFYNASDITAIGFENIETYQVIKVSKDQMSFKAFNWNGELKDQFIIKHK